MATVLLLGWAVGDGSTTIDTSLTRYVTGVFGTEPRWLLAFSDSAMLSAVAAGCVAVAVHRRRWRTAVAMLVCPLAAVAAGEALKHIFDRRNGPYLEYPSGHTALTVAVTGMAVVIAARGRRAVAISVLVAAVTASALGMLGLIACGYHYPTDTVGGALLATAFVCIAALLIRPAPPMRGREPTRDRLGIAVVIGAFAPAVLTAAGPAVAEPVPLVGAAASAAGFVDVRGVVPDAIVDLRYATADNFTGERLYPPDARCLVHESLAAGLTAAAAELRRQGRTLVFWDCYRPHPVQVRMFEIVPDPNWVARPGRFARSHEAARSVDVTFAEPADRCPARAGAGGSPCLAEMGTGFDDFSTRANAFATDGIGSAAVANRAALRAAMGTGGLAPYAGEWWHFDGPGAGVDRPLYDVEVG